MNLQALLYSRASVIADVDSVTEQDCQHKTERERDAIIRFNNHVVMNNAADCYRVNQFMKIRPVLSAKTFYHCVC